MPKRVTTEPRDRGPAILAPARFGGYPGPLRKALPGGKLTRFLATTDHKQIGLLYLLTSFGFFLVAGIQAMLMRAELARPNLQFLSAEQYNQLFTSHGAVMLLLFATPRRSGSPTTSCRSRSAPPTCRSPGSTPSRTGSTCSAA